MSISLQSDSYLSQYMLDITGDTISLTSDSALLFSAQVKSVYQQACLTLIKQAQYVTSLNGVLPDLNGTLLMLGSGCVSVVDATDTTDPESTPADQHTINIFDGCAACNDCDSVWLISQLVKLCHIWTIGLKDCVLYYEPAAAQLWDRLFSDRNTVVLDQLKYITDWSGNCSYRAQLLPLDRRLRLSRATKLLYQYKAVVAMWNYLVYNISSRMRVLATVLDYTGLSVKLKRRFNLCNNPALSVVLHITAKRTGQAMCGYVKLQRQTTLISIIPILLGMLITQQTTSESDEPVPYGLAFYVLPTTENTYILKYTDRGGEDESAYVTKYGSIPNAISTDINISFTLTLSIIDANIIFSLGVFSGLLTCSALLKIIPVFIANITAPSTTKLNLALYALHAHKNATYSLALITNTNRWYIQTLWLCLNTPTLLDASYFTTAYNLYPTKFLLLSTGVSTKPVDYGDSGLAPI